MTSNDSKRAVEKARALPWKYALGDPVAREMLGRRLAPCAHERNKTITYSDLAMGVMVRLSSVAGGTPFELGAPDWSDLHRAIVGDFLGHLSCASLERHGVLLSAVVVGKHSGEPGVGFYTLLRQLGLTTSRRADDLHLIWSVELNKVYDWYAVHDWDGE